MLGVDLSYTQRASTRNIGGRGEQEEYRVKVGRPVPVDVYGHSQHPAPHKCDAGH